MTTFIKVHSVANNYTITMGNIFGRHTRITGRGNKATAIQMGIMNAKSNNLNHIFLKVGNGAGTLISISELEK